MVVLVNAVWREDIFMLRAAKILCFLLYEDSFIQTQSFE